MTVVVFGLVGLLMGLFLLGISGPLDTIDLSSVDQSGCLLTYN